MTKLSLVLLIGLPILWFVVPTDVAGWLIILWMVIFCFWLIILRTMVEDYALKGMGKHWNDKG
jgi:hypothetical protein